MYRPAEFRSAAVALAVAAGVLAPVAAAAAPVPTKASQQTAAAAGAIGAVSKYVPVAPSRILDTRTGVGAPARAVPPQGSLDLLVNGVGGVPASGASAVVLNVTIVGATGIGHVSAYPAGTDGRSTSVINHTRSTPIIAGLVTAPVGAKGRVTLYTAAGGHLLADVLGYYTPSSASSDGRFVALTPSRTLDTRSGGKPAAGSSRALQVTGQGGVPAGGVSAVALNVTATAVDRPGFVQVIPTGGSTPVAESSNINTSSAGQTVANLVIVPVGRDGQVTLYTSQAAHLIADVTGYFTDNTAASSTNGLFQAVQPTRELDTRVASGYFGTNGQRPVAGSQTQIDMSNRSSVPSSGVGAVALGVTAVATQGTGFVQVFPAGQAAPGSASTLGFARDQVIANAALTPVGAARRISVYVSTSTHLLADVFGYYLSGTSTTAPAPTASPTPTSDPLTGLVIAPANTTVAYSRDSWPHWIDADGDCQDTRAEVLIVESLAPVSFTSTNRCTVAAGQWHDPYSGRTWTLASDLDVDHFVPLANAHRSGGHAWDRARKQAFANDLGNAEHLIAVEDNLNQAKSDRGPEAWKPPLSSYWCEYATNWATVKKRWTLTVTQPEHDALRDMLGTCTVTSPTSSPQPTVTATPGPTTSPTPTAGPAATASPTPASTRPANPGDTKNCGDFSTWRAAQDWFEYYYAHYGDVARLDADGDRIACESLPGSP